MRDSFRFEDLMPWLHLSVLSRDWALEGSSCRLWSSNTTSPATSRLLRPKGIEYSLPERRTISFLALGWQWSRAGTPPLWSLCCYLDYACSEHCDNQLGQLVPQAETALED